MAKCIFCGREAQAGSKSHGACIDVYSTGKTWITAMIGAFVSNERELHELKYAISLVAKLSYINNLEMRSLILQGYKQAVDQALEDHLLSVEEERCLEAIQANFDLSNDELEELGCAEKVMHARVIRHISEGKQFEFPIGDIMLPFNLQRSEILVWGFADVDYYEQQTRSRIRIGSHEVSAELASLYMRTSEVSAEVVKDDQMVLVDSGVVGITTKHIYFAGTQRRLRINYQDVVSFKAYTDGIGVVQDGNTSGSHVFLTDKGWFTYNLVANLAQRAS